MANFTTRRAAMVESQIKARGVRDPRVLAAMREVPREKFVGGRYHDLAYEDAPLPIEEGQTISQPYIVALMLEAARLKPSDRVLEVGSGSGYVLALLSHLVADASGIEWHEALATLAAERLREVGAANARVMRGDGTLGWPDRAPFDAIIVSAGGPEIPPSLLAQLAPGGRLVIPVGIEARSQELLLITRTGDHAYDRESLGKVQFVPLVGSEGWSIDGTVPARRPAARPLHLAAAERTRLAGIVAEGCEPFESVEHAPLDAILKRIGDARVVLIGESTHGTREFYRLRARITEALISRAGFNMVAIEGDWPDVAAIDRRVRRRAGIALREPMFSRFPTWMWRNDEMQRFTEWLAARNACLKPAEQTSVHGLDIYGLNNSIGAVIEYLDRVDSFAAELARERYACFSPWERDPAVYGRAVVSGAVASCEVDAVSTLKLLLDERLRYCKLDGDDFFDAARNATVVTQAERYYRAIYRGSRESWNLRDRHMFETLMALLEHRGPDSRAVIWAHNSHVGNAAATEMGQHGEISLGQLARERFGDRAYLVGMGTDSGTVCAASSWDGPMEPKSVRSSHADSYERVFHESGVGAFYLPLRSPNNLGVRTALLAPRLERAIGVIYRPETELVSHYFQATLPAQFDEYIWIDRTNALQALSGETVPGIPETYPFAL
jgi:protein-L-isoaspartate(D-aspartate) O-methyltransferase